MGLVGAGGGGASSGSGPTVVADTLACLDRARPPDGFDTPRVLDDGAHRLAFDAWEIARADIVQRWNHLADKANLEPRVPPAPRPDLRRLRRCCNEQGDEPEEASA